MKQFFKIFAAFMSLALLAFQLAQAEPVKALSTALKPQEMATRINKASASLKVGKALDVISNLKPVAAELPRKGLLILAKAYHQQKNYLDETRTLEVTLGMNPKDYYVQSLLGEAYFSNRNYEKAIENFASARELKNDFLPAFEGLEKTYEAQTQLEDARSLTEDLINKFGGMKKHRNQLCRLYSTDGIFQEGIDACKKAVSFDPKFADNHIYLGQMLIGNEQVERGEQIVLKAAKQFQKSELAQFAAGDIKLKHKQWLEAGRYFSQGTIADPTSDRNYLGWGQALLEMQKFADAKFAITKACTINRKNLPELRKAIANLRQKNQSAWATQFEANLPKCGG
jgi:tetratricopeptide (TPR) repeat protein